MSTSPPAAASSPRLEPEQLRALVLDYLCHNCYTGTARTFARESAVRTLDADGDEVMAVGGHDMDLPEVSEGELRLIELRKDIRTLILSGKGNEATAMLNEHFPAVLSESFDTASDRAPASTAATTRFIFARSVDPSHLSLNLRILSFVEACRTVPLDYNPAPTPAPQAAAASSSASASAAPSPPAPHTTSSSAGPAHESHNYYPTAPEPDDAHQTELLARARKLYLQVNALARPGDRARYLEELGNVGGLLAYKVPERSPMVKYLGQARREAVADQINSAILHRTGQSSVSRLELYTRYTSVMWSFMHDLRIKPPPAGKRPAGVELPPQSEKGGVTSMRKLSTLEKDAESVPAFDLRQFLDSAP